MLPTIAPALQCDGLLASIAAINLFSVLAFVLVVGVRWCVPDRSYKEACLVTYVLVALDMLLKLVDASLPIVLTATCFADSITLNMNGTMLAPNCVVPCALGDLYATYGFYGIGKSAVGIADMIVATPFLVSKPLDWYRWGATRLK